MQPPDSFTAITLFSRSAQVALQTLGHSLVLFFTLVGLPLAVMVGGVAMLEPDSGAWAAVFFLSVVLIMLFGVPLAMAGVSVGVFKVMRGQPVVLGETFREILPHTFSLILTLLCTVVVTLIGYMMCIVPGIIALVGFYVAIPAVVLDSATPFDAMVRSWKLTEGHKLSIFVFFLLLQLINYAGLIPGALLEGTDRTVAAIVGIFWLLAMLAVGYISIVSYGVAYSDLRYLKEGDDSEKLVEVFN